MKDPFILRMTIENMQYQIMQAIYPREVELKERIGMAVQKAINEFDFEEEIQRQVRNHLRNDIQERVRVAVQNTVHTSPLHKTIQAEVERQLKEQERL